MIELREEQQKVAAYRQGYLAVPAVPGAGKTTTLAMLAANLIQLEKQRVGKILIVTCMNSAVANFKSRIASFLKEYGLPPGKGYEVKTLHSLAMKIIRKKPQALHIVEEFNILDEFQQKDLIRRESLQWIEGNQELFKSALELRKRDTQEKIRLNQERWQENFIQLVGELVKLFKCYRLSEKNLPFLFRDLSKDSFLIWAGEIYLNYQKYLVLNGSLDFDDLIVKAVDLLKDDPVFLAQMQEEWYYIFEDEAQDSNPLQEEMLLMLAARKHNLVRVGDLNQAIMSTFTISDAKLFQKYCQGEKTRVLPITCSSRSAQPIIDLANYLVLWSRSKHPDQSCRNALEEQIIQPAPPEDKFPNPCPEKSKVGCRAFSNKEKERSSVVRYAADYVKRNPEKTVAILSPSNSFLEEIADELTAQGLEYQELTRYPRERRRAMEILGDVLDYLSHPHYEEKLLRVLVRLEFLVEEERKIFLPFLRKAGLENILYPLDQVLQEADLPQELRKENRWQRFSKGLEKLKLFLSVSRVQPEILILYLAQELSFSEEDLAIAQRIALEVQRLINLHPNWRLTDLAQELKSVHNSFNHFANLVYERRGYEPKPGQINLSTYHKAKGMEWDTVYLTNLVPLEFPANSKGWFRSDASYLKPEYRNPTAAAKAQLEYLLKNQGTDNPREAANREVIEEKLRLLYVGVTRAKENLLLSGYLVDGEKSIYLQVLEKYLEAQNND